MSRKMTVVFHNEELYTDLKVEAARRHIAASDILAEAGQERLGVEGRGERVALIKAGKGEQEKKGGGDFGCNLARPISSNSVRPLYAGLPTEGTPPYLSERSL